MSGFYSFIRFQLVPSTFIFIFPTTLYWLVKVGQRDLEYSWEQVIGNAFSWKFVAVCYLWAIIFLKVPSKIFKGPITEDGQVPEYKANGLQYYLITTVTTVLVLIFFPGLSLDIVKNYGQIYLTFSLSAFALCLALVIKGIRGQKRNQKRGNFLYEFYRGMELHPMFFGINIKQLTNCRIGMMLWQVLITIDLCAGWVMHGFNPGHFVNVALQTIYIAKFFWWETGYFTTLDITMDRAGYYLCWGCLVWVPCFYTFSSFYYIYNPPSLSLTGAVVLFVLGFLSIVFNYLVDYQKQVFKATRGKCTIWGRNPSYIQAEYTSVKGKHKTHLLTSGYWAIARHVNYDFEILLSLCWCAPGLAEVGFWPYLYVIYLFILLIHRVFRDEEKCLQKYGRYWEKYCSVVKYRMVPYIW